jgi:hypothetical protein
MDGVGAMATGDVEAVKFISSTQTKRFTNERVIDGSVVPAAVKIHAYLMLVVHTVHENSSLARTRRHVER